MNFDPNKLFKNKTLVYRISFLSILLALLVSIFLDSLLMYIYNMWFRPAGLGAKLSGLNLIDFNSAI